MTVWTAVSTLSQSIETPITRQATQLTLTRGNTVGFKSFKIEHGKHTRELDPLKLFDSLTLRGSVNNLWGPQIDALKKWHAVRSRADVSIEMNTGAGKTLVGLLVATSLARELQKMVVYVCPTIQLVQQTVTKAKECSIEVATYYAQEWVNAEIAEAATGPCVTTHQAVFNGLSTFRNRDIGAVVLDDAHAASGIIRDCFTLKLQESSDIFKEVAELFRPYFRRASHEMTFDEVLSGSKRDLLFVPLHVSCKLASQVRDKLLANGVADHLETKFVWAHLKDRLDRCTFLLNGDRIEIAPACLPTDSTPAFSKSVRRVYLTATLPSATEFYRTFGALPERVCPEGRSGEAQRVFLDAHGVTDDDQRKSAKQLLKDRKAFILSGSGWQAREWRDVASLFGKKDDHARIEEFAAAKPPEKLVMAGRYDGVDLPGDACRILVLDGLPMGEALLPRYVSESLRIDTVRASSTAVRIVQAVGRIFRSNTDHGAVVLVGNRLHRWIDSPFNRSFLPPLLQQQFELAVAIDKKLNAGEVSAPDVIDAVLEGQKEWDEFYGENIGQFASRPPSQPPGWLTDAVQREHMAHRKMWQNNFTEAATEYSELAAATEQNDADLAAWFRHFEGYCYERSNKPDLAASAYVQAANRRASLGRPVASGGKPPRTTGVASEQAERVLKIVRTEGGKALTRIKAIPPCLVYSTSPNQFEQALRDFGTYLGVDSSRPDNELKAGPDVLWLSDSGRGHAFEAKTDKKQDGEYTKTEIGQAHNHRQWLLDKHPGKTIGLSIVGRLLSVSPYASPDDELTVLEVAPLREIAGKVMKLYEELTTNAVDAETVESWIVHLGLKFPMCIEAMSQRMAADLQGDGGE